MADRTGYTPIFDCVKHYKGANGKKLGHVTALIFGIIWRFCQFQDKESDVVRNTGICWASHDTIAEIATTSSKTVQRHVGKLIKIGFIKKMGAHESYRTPIYAVTARVTVKNMVASVLDLESSIDDHGGLRVQGGVDLESRGGVDLESNKETSNKETSITLDTIDKTEVLSALDPSSLAEVSHYDVSGCTLYADLDGDGFKPYVNVHSTPQRVKLQTGEGPDDLKYKDPSKITMIYLNGGTEQPKLVVIGQKQGQLIGAELHIFTALKELFTISSVASKNSKERHHQRLKEIAINVVMRGYGPDTVQMWSYWHDQTRPELSATKSEQVNSFEKTLDKAHQWAVENGLILEDSLQEVEAVI